MLPSAISPFTIPPFNFCSKPMEALRGSGITNGIWNLHSIFVNPASMLHDVRILPLPQIIAAPFPLPSEGKEAQAVRARFPKETALSVNGARKLFTELPRQKL